MLAIQAEEGEGSGHPSKPQPPPSTAQPTNEEPILNTSEPIPNVPDETVYEEWDDRVERATTTAASLDAKHASGGSPRCQEAMGGSIAQTRSERVPTPPRDSPLLRVHTLRSDEGSWSSSLFKGLSSSLFCLKLKDFKQISYMKKPGLEEKREEKASNAALIEEWDSIKARIDADAQLPERLQAEKR
ncbi:hypothetical protein Tco_1051929 [Tanacetum coccineum]